MIPYSHQSIDENDIMAVGNVLRSDYLTCGPKIEEFEEAFADYVGADYAVAISSGTAALHASLSMLNLQPGDEVITTPITFAATANAILYVGAKPVFVDIDPITYNIDPEDIKRKITNKTKVILPVHFTGWPCDMEAINQIALDNGLFVIEDACHALGAKYQRHKIGSISEMSCFSFHPVKHITTGEGGMIAVNRFNKLANKLKEFRSHGRDNQGYQLSLGYNYRMTDFQAALGKSQLKKADKFLNERRDIALNYYEWFFKNNEINVIYPQGGIKSSSWHLFVIQVANRNKVMQYMKSKGIGVQIHYMPVYWHPYYEQLGYQKGLCPNAEEYYSRCLSLPCYPGLTIEQQDYVIQTLREALDEFSNNTS